MHNKPWFKDAVIYEVHVKSFYDSNGDGIGDFRGLIEKIDYFTELGVTAIWLLPFYPSPLRDDGYDISDYVSVNPAYGTMEDFREFLQAAHQRGLKVITELVINHTSDQHPWFQRARRTSVGSPERDFYVWSESPGKYSEARIIFKDFEPSNWSWDPVAKAYYWHRFFAHQPDLNFDNPAVHEAVFMALDFWLEMGVDGLRLDAVPYLYEREGSNCENLPETHAFLKKLRRYVDAKFENRMLLAEANQWPEDAAAYFGDGDECHMNFHFPIMPRLFMALQMEDRFPIIDILDQTPPIPESCQWATFLRNHDELTLEMVTDEERDYMYRVYANDLRARINLGIRRRLAPLLGNNRRRIELINALLFSLPGTPIVYYGDEIGMGDNFYLGDRNGVRTPMQWAPDRNGGFSRCNPQQLYLPAIIDPEYHYEAVNVETQRGNNSSLFWWMRRLIAERKRWGAFGHGTIQFLQPQNAKVLAFVREYADEAILVVANLSRFTQATELDLSPYAGLVPMEVFSRAKFPEMRQGGTMFTLGPHDFYWLALRRKGSAGTSDSASTVPVVDHTIDWSAGLRLDLRDLLERDLLPMYFESCRWFPRNRTLREVKIIENFSLVPEPGAASVLFIHTLFTEGLPETFILPVQCSSGELASRILSESPRAVIARFSGGQEEQILHDALYDGGFRTALLQSFGNRAPAHG
ncbi:MAG TPA: maltose alpha-D-glucosyltransferase, partial [Chthoniobacteraceae bacterium]